MSHTYEKVSGNKAKLTFTIPAEQFDEAMQKAYLKLRGRINVPGFRKGKAPRRMIETLYGEGVFYDDAFELIFPDVYEAAVKEFDLHPVDRPEIDLDEIGAGKDLKFHLEVFVRPDVKLGDYKGLTVETEQQKLTDEMVEARIAQDQDKASRTIDVEDRPVQDGDTVNLDYAGTVDGVAFAGGTAENQTLKIGSHTFIPGFEEQMVGMKIGEERDVNVTFPEDYQAENLKGKPAVFKVKLHELSYEQLPELDDEFASETSEFETLAELKDSIRAELQVRADKDRELAIESAVIQKVIENAKVEIHKELVDAEAHAELHNLEHQLADIGLKMEDYANYMGTTVDDLHDRYHHMAEDQIKARTVIQSVIDAEKLEPEDQDYEKAVRAYSERADGWDEEKIEHELLPENRMKYAQSALYEAFVRLVKDNAVITEKDDEK